MQIDVRFKDRIRALPESRNSDLSLRQRTPFPCPVLFREDTFVEGRLRKTLHYCLRLCIGAGLSELRLQTKKQNSHWQ